MNKVVKTYRVEIAVPSSKKSYVSTRLFSFHLFSGVIQVASKILGCPMMDIDGSIIDLNSPDTITVRDLETKISSMAEVASYVASILGDENIESHEDKIKSIKDVIFGKVSDRIYELNTQLDEARERVSKEGRQEDDTGDNGQ